MASNTKKTNRSRGRGAGAGEPRNYSQLYRASAAGSARVMTVTNDRETVTVIKNSSAIDWQHEYAYVFQDLRRLFIVTGVLVLAIIATQFIL